MPAEQLALTLRPDERVSVARAARPRRPKLRLVHSQIPLFRARVIPETRGDCSWARDAEGYPCCPYLSCRHHLFNDRPEAFEKLVDAPWPHKEKWPQTCSLDVADAVDAALPGQRIIGVGELLKRSDPTVNGTLRLSDVGALMGCSGERARQLEASGSAKVRDAAPIVDAFEDYDPAPGFGEWRAPELDDLTYQPRVESVRASKPGPFEGFSW